MTENQQKLSDCLLLLSNDSIEEQQLFEKLSIICIKHYKINFIPIHELDYETLSVVQKRYNGSVQDYFFDSINCMAFKKVIPKLINFLTY